jgi:16S rRNA (uracil1498-N3)-methyltransferase
MPATPAWPPRSAPRLFVATPLARGEAVAVEGNQAHYLARVMRVGDGDTVILCDDITGEWAAQVVSVGKREVVLAPDALLRPREQVPDFWLCAALLKKDRFDLVLEKASELGVRRVQPVLARRCVADKLNLERARAVMTEAAEQCARTALPELAEPVKLEALLRAWPAERRCSSPTSSAASRRWLHSPPVPARPRCVDRPRRRIRRCRARGGRALPQARPITLGPRILRGETAAIAATALWMGTAGDW